VPPNDSWLLINFCCYKREKEQEQASANAKWASEKEVTNKYKEKMAQKQVC
jgi:hypothetical protein